MRPFHLGRWGSILQNSPVARRACPQCQQRLRAGDQFRTLTSTRSKAEDEVTSETPVKRRRGRPRKNPLPTSSDQSPTSRAIPDTDIDTSTSPLSNEPALLDSSDTSLPSRPPTTPIISSGSYSSAKLAALHARLALPSQFPIESLARALIHPTADPDRNFNNSSFTLLGASFLNYHITEHLICNYPRLPVIILNAARKAYVGSKALSVLAQEWGVEIAAEPGTEVDAGLLQFKRAPPGWRQPATGRTVRDKNIEYLMDGPPDASKDVPVATLDKAASQFAEAVFGALYVHAGATVATEFFKGHILSRKLDLASLFTFTQPTRDLSRLCAREGFEPPVARLLSESGRLSRHPVFVVGVYSGSDKLGEGAGSSLHEGRFRAAVAALKGWYLYSPSAAEPVVLPSQASHEYKAGRAFKPIHVDIGEVVV